MESSDTLSIGAFFLYFCRPTFIHLQIHFNMGRGDKKTKKGKIFKGSYGKSRPARLRKVVSKGDSK